ncbi:amino acid permease, putative [Bodo saltans]|uniref:Amino acid permease, putative n=1 Tax=Bodo saltans TaxID=75058 RepID=A0A0S4JBT0_BODSA|nr:amino acid permease, putative [Bodo saltans]|eukprot:CUG87841.1 amino acid permease, putative [Bodo saltans]
MAVIANGDRKLTWWQLALITFVFTSAGPFGMESSVNAAGPRNTILLIFAVPLFHVLPMVLIVTEMSSWMPTNHGSVLWIARAYGPVVGFISAIMQMFISMVDISVYPVLLVNYLSSAFFPDIEPLPRYLLELFFIAVGSIPAFLHVGDMGRVSGVVLALICLPFVVSIAYLLPQCDPAKWWVTKSDVDVATSWSTGIWMYTGFMALGALGAEVKHHSVFLMGCGAAALLDIIMYLLPLLVALQVPGEWGDGFLVHAFGTLMPGMTYAISIAGALSGFGLYTTSMTCFSRSVWGIADRGWLPRIFTRTSPSTGAPYAACILLLLTSSVLGLFDFDFLVALLLVISSCNFALFYTAFLLLRYREPYAYRPFRIPGGKVGAWLLVSPIIVVYFTLFVATVVENFLIDLLLLLMVAVLVALYIFVVRPAHAASPGAGEFHVHDVEEPEWHQKRRLEAQRALGIDDITPMDDCVTFSSFPPAETPQASHPDNDGSTCSVGGGGVSSTEETVLVHHEALEELPSD